MNSNTQAGTPVGAPLAAPQGGASPAPTPTVVISGRTLRTEDMVAIREDYGPDAQIIDQCRVLGGAESVRCLERLTGGRVVLYEDD